MTCSEEVGRAVSRNERIDLTFDVCLFIVVGELDPRLDSLLISFSLYTNVKELFNFSRSANAIGFLSGIKALSYFGIIFLHSISSRLLFPLRNPREAENFLNSHLNSFAIGLYFCVDSFLLISGYLMTKSIFKELDRKSFSLWKTYFRRYMRITPVVIASMLHIAGFWNYLPPKDPYNFYKDHQEMCSKYWWAKLLHVQNYVNVRELVRKLCELLKVSHSVCSSAIM